MRTYILLFFGVDSCGNGLGVRDWVTDEDTLFRCVYCGFFSISSRRFALNCWFSGRTDEWVYRKSKDIDFRRRIKIIIRPASVIGMSPKANDL